MGNLTKARNNFIVFMNHIKYLSKIGETKKKKNVLINLLIVFARWPKTEDFYQKEGQVCIVYIAIHWLVKQILLFFVVKKHSTKSVIWTLICLEA